MPKNNALQNIINILDQLVTENLDFDGFLKKLIKLLNELMPADSILIYLYDGEGSILRLVGSKHNKDLKEEIKMKPGEGITGWVLNHEKTVAIPKEAYKDRRFKGFKNLPQDKFEAFLSVPISSKDGVIGVINIQIRDEYKFVKSDISTIESLVKIISAAFQKQILKNRVVFLENKLEERKLIEKAKGILMKQKNISETKAYEVMRSESMRKRKTMKQLAEAIILVWG